MKKYLHPSYSPWCLLPLLFGGATISYLLISRTNDSLAHQSLPLPVHSPLFSIDGMVYDPFLHKSLFISDVDGDGAADALHIDNKPYWVADQKQFAETLNGLSIPVMPSDLRDAATRALHADQDLSRLLERYHPHQQSLPFK